jgi:hypothetical protein
MNQSAFPWMVDDGKTVTGNKGMTLRDYFAAKAMQGLMATERAGEYVDEEGYEMIGEEGESGTLFIHTKFFVEEAYMIADMMLKAREQ